MCVLEVGERPETKIAEIYHEYLQEGPFRVLAGFVEVIFGKFLAWLVLLGQLGQLLPVDFDVSDMLNCP